MPARQQESGALGAAGADPGGRGKRVSTAELAKHNTMDDCWVACDGKVYDVTRWVPLHPGGSTMVVTAAGRDITYLMPSYHPFSEEKALRTLERYQIGVYDNTKHPVYESPDELKEFYPTLRRRVGEYFKENKLDYKWHPQLWLRLALLYGGLFGFYFGIYHWATSLSTVVLFAMLLGATQSLWAVQLMHDASHCAITHSPFVWRFIGACFDTLTGASFWSWMYQHVVGHHIYTNVRGMDPDVTGFEREGKEVRRISPTQTYYDYYSWQHLYLWPLYTLYGLKNRVQGVTEFLSQNVGTSPGNPPAPLTTIPGAPRNSGYWLFWGARVFYVTVRIVLPFFTSDIPALWHVGSYVLAEMVVGMYLVMNFQVAHSVDTVSHMEYEDGLIIKDDWAAAQVRTSQDFAHDSKFWTFESGALNFQTVHHLFPAISQCHYPAINPIVMKTCKEFGVPFHHAPTYTQALLSHYNFLAQLSKRGSGRA